MAESPQVVRMAASLDASFWINAHQVGLTAFLPEYSESLARRRLDWACAAYGRGEIDVRGAARYTGLSLYEMLDELKRRGIEIASSEQFLDGLNDLADLFDLPELRAAAAAVTVERA